MIEPKHAPIHVLLIREQAEQLTGGCCGTVGDDDLLSGGRELFADARRDQLALGAIHRLIRDFFPPIDGREQVLVDAVDPRNQFYLFFRLWREVWRYRPGLRAGLQTALQFFSLPAVIVNGRVVSRRGGPLDADAFCRAVREARQGRETTD